MCSPASVLEPFSVFWRGRDGAPVGVCADQMGGGWAGDSVREKSSGPRTRPRLDLRLLIGVCVDGVVTFGEFLGDVVGADDLDSLRLTVARSILYSARGAARSWKIQSAGFNSVSQASTT